jgi:peptide-methionine (R)-S-oxide reductase
MLKRMGGRSAPAAPGAFPLAKSEAEFKQELSAQEYRMLRQAGTERPGTGEYHKFFPAAGHFACRACAAPLYSAGAKFQDCGWDAFDRCYHRDDFCAVGVRPDAGGLEIICNSCGSHLGHVFYGERSTPTDERH